MNNQNENIKDLILQTLSDKNVKSIIKGIVKQALTEYNQASSNTSNRGTSPQSVTSVMIYAASELRDLKYTGPSLTKKGKDTGWDNYESTTFIKKKKGKQFYGTRRPIDGLTLLQATVSITKSSYTLESMYDKIIDMRSQISTHHPNLIPLAVVIQVPNEKNIYYDLGSQTLIPLTKDKYNKLTKNVSLSSFK